MFVNRRGACLLLLVATACSTTSILGPRNDDREVYSAVLDTLAAPHEQFVVMDSTIAIRQDAPLLSDVARGYMGADSAMGAGLREASRVAHPLPRLHTRRSGVFMTRAELDAGGWRSVARASGYFRVSGIGYARDRKRAIVYVQHLCGFNCYTSWLLTVVASSGRWRVEAVQMQTVV